MTAPHSNAPRRPRRRGLLARVFAANLVVVAVAAVGALIVGQALAPLVLERHLGSMGMMAGGARGPGFAAMTADLEVAYRSALLQSIGWAVGIATLAAAAVAWFVTARLIAPLRALRAASAAIASGRPGARLDADAPGEIGDVAASFNAMAEALEEGDAVRRRLVTDLAHELRTPLSNLRGTVEALEDGVFELDDVTRTGLRRQVERLERLVADLATLHDLEAGQVAIDARPTDLAALANASHAAFQARFAERGVALEVHAPARGAVAFGDPVRIGQVLENLLSNALRHTPCGGRVDVVVASGAAAVRVEVRDTGPGVPEREREAVFRRFYRGDPARATDGGTGTGVGLTIAKTLVERQGGRIEVGAAPGGGALFAFTVPTAPRDAAAATETRPAM